MNVSLQLYAGEQAVAVFLIRAFWHCHNNWEPTEAEARENLTDWTAPGHRLYFIQYEGESVGFLHLGSRGAACDWLEDLFVLPRFQRRGIGREAVTLAEEIVKAYSSSLYIEAAARNDAAIRLYHRLGYQCLNTITIRRDFTPELFETLKTEQIHDLPFEIRKRKE